MLHYKHILNERSSWTSEYFFCIIHQMKDKMPDHITDGPAEPDENWEDLKEVMEEITQSLHLELLWLKEKQKWEKK